MNCVNIHSFKILSPKHAREHCTGWEGHKSQAGHSLILDLKLLVPYHWQQKKVFEEHKFEFKLQQLQDLLHIKCNMLLVRS